MKTADVTVGTEYAYLGYSYNDPEYTRLSNGITRRVLVTAIHPGGKVSIEMWDRDSKTFKRYNTRPVMARGLIMPWADAQPIFKEIRERRETQAKLNREQQEREQVALRALGEFLESHDALGMPGLPYDLKGSIALANGIERSESHGYDLPNRHQPTLGLNVITLVALLRKAYGDGYDDALGNHQRDDWTQEVSG